MKRIAAGLLAFIMVIGAAAVLPQGFESKTGIITASAETLEENGWEYSVWDGKGTINKYTGDETEVTLPTSLGGVPIVAIDPHTDGWSGAASAFNKTNVKKVIIPPEITRIDIYTFFAAKNVEEIEVDPENPNYASYDGILYSKDMKKLIMCPEGKKGDVVVPDGVERINNENLGAFEDCNYITSINFPDSVTDIGDRNFRYCFALKSFNIPKNAVVTDYLGYPDVPDLLRCENLEEIIVSEENENFLSDDGQIYAVYEKWEEFNKVLFFAPKDRIHIAADCTEIVNGINLSRYLPDRLIDDRADYEIIGDGLYHNSEEGKALVAYKYPSNILEVAEGTVHIYYWSSEITAAILPDSINDQYLRIGKDQYGNLMKNFVIYANEGSNGHKYALDNNITWHPIGYVEETEPDDKPEDTKPTEPDKQPEDTKPTEPDKQPEDTKPTEPDKQSEDTKPTEPDKQPEDTKPTDQENQGTHGDQNTPEDSSDNTPQTGAAVGIGAIGLCAAAVTVATKKRRPR